MARAMRCAVVGGANIDIGGFPDGGFAMRDSNPGRVRLSAGGVGRNIACCLARLGVETHLVTALGGDAFADAIRAGCLRAGALLDGALVFEDMTSSVYLFIADHSGDMRAAVNDMAVCARLTPEALEGKLDWLNAMDAVVLDANLPRETLEWLAEKITVPLIADAVSAAKAPRLKGTLPRLRAIKPNGLEAAALTGLPVNDPAEGLAAARALVRMGAARAFVTLGTDGVCCADESEAFCLTAPPVTVLNATGAGDAFTAALTWAELRGLGLSEAARAGIAAAALAVESVDTVNEAMNEGVLTERIKGQRAAVHRR